MKPSAPNFAVLVQNFFCERLMQQQNVSGNTVNSYRDTFRLLLAFAQEHTQKDVADVELSDLDAPLVMMFLDDLEHRRGNTIRTRNTRLAALRSFMKYAALCNPAALPVAQRVLSIPMKRFDRPLLGYLTREEVVAITKAPDLSTWSGRRDRALLTVLYNTGIRVSEAISLCRTDATLSPTRELRICGKGRKQRQVPLWKSTATLLSQWIREVDTTPGTPLFPNRHGRPMSRSGVEDRLQRAVAIAARQCHSLATKSVSPHTLRHTTAMHLLQSGVDITVIALWLGHESPGTTHQYVEADLAMKQRALATLEELPAKTTRYKPKTELLRFLDNL